jgi:phosphoserine phosphatase RsbU/P
VGNACRVAHVREACVLKSNMQKRGFEVPVVQDDDGDNSMSNLFTDIGDVQADERLEAVAQTGAALLHVDFVLIFLRDDDGELVFAGGSGAEAGDPIIEKGRAIARQALSEERLDQYIVPAEHGRSKAFPHRASATCVPIVSEAVEIGAVVAISQVGTIFSTSDIEILSVVAARAASALHIQTDSGHLAASAGHDHIIQLAQMKIKYLSLVNQVSDALSSTLELEELLRISLEQSTSAIGAQAGSLMLINEETGSLEIAASLGLKENVVDTTKLAVGSSIAGWVAQHGESALIRDARRDDRFSMEFFRDEISSSASVPLRTKGQVIGVLNVSTTAPGRIFDKRDLQLLETVANQMAAAIDNARLYQRVQSRTKQLDILLQISRTITETLNLDEVLQRLSSAICHVLHLEACCIMLVDDLTDRFRFGYGSGFKVKRRHAYLEAAVPAAQKVRKTGKRVVVRDVSRSRGLSTEVSQSENLRGLVALPMRNQNKTVAVFVGFSRETLVLTESQRAIMGQLAELGGVAVHNARVYRQKYRMAQMLQNRLIPAEAPTVNGLDIGHAFLPAREVGGDYYDFLQLDSGELGIVVGDVSGSDVEAAEYTTMGKHILRAYARRERCPAKVLRHTNDHICDDTRAEVFISVFYGTIDVEKKKLRYANGGCEPAMIFRAASGNLEVLNAAGILVGICRDQPFEDCKTDLNPGDVILIFTDGLPEACAGGERLGTSTLSGLIRSCRKSSAQVIADRMKDHLLGFVSGQVSDDCAIVVVKIQ